MPITLIAVVDQSTLATLLADITPLDIDLGGEEVDHGRWLTIDRARRVELVPTRGVRIETSARVTWKVAGVVVPITIQSISVLLELSIGGPPEGGRLIAKPRIESADLKNVPPSIDRRLVARINEQLEAQPPVIGWSFAKTLDITIALPERLKQLAAFHIATSDAKIEIDNEAVKISLAMPMDFQRR